MEIKTDEVLRVYEKYSDEQIPIVYLSDNYVQNDNNLISLLKGTNFDSSHYELLKKANIAKLNIVYNERLFAKLVACFPVTYRLPIGRKNIIEIDRIINSLEDANGLSKRKRNLITVCELYKKGDENSFEPILHFGDKLNYKKWNDIKVNLNRNAVIDYRLDECGIIIFYLLNSNDSYYAQKFMRFTDLVSVIVESKNTGVTISQDFIPESDVYTVNDKTKLLEVYNDTKASLIIIGEDLNEDYKIALNQIKLFDRFARMMVIKNTDTTQKIDILNKIKQVYGIAVWEE